MAKKQQSPVGQKMQISKEQLKRLQEQRGKVDTDSGKVFVKPVGKPVKQDDASQWEVTLLMEDRNPDLKYGEFSIRATLAGQKTEPEHPKAKAAKPPADEPPAVHTNPSKEK